MKKTILFVLAFLNIVYANWSYISKNTRIQIQGDTLGIAGRYLTLNDDTLDSFFGIRTVQQFAYPTSDDSLLYYLPSFKAIGVRQINLCLMSDDEGNFSLIEPDGSLDIQDSLEMFERILDSLQANDIVGWVTFFNETSPVLPSNSDACWAAIRNVTNWLKPYRNIAFYPVNEQGKPTYPASLPQLRDTSYRKFVLDSIKSIDPNRIVSVGGYAPIGGYSWGDVNAWTGDFLTPQTYRPNYIIKNNSDDDIGNGIYTFSQKNKNMEKISKAKTDGIYFNWWSHWVHEYPPHFDLRGDGVFNNRGDGWMYYYIDFLVNDLHSMQYGDNFDRANNTNLNASDSGKIKNGNPDEWDWVEVSNSVKIDSFHIEPEIWGADCFVRQNSALSSEDMFIQCYVEQAQLDDQANFISLSLRYSDVADTKYDFQYRLVSGQKALRISETTGGSTTSLTSATLNLSLPFLMKFVVETVGSDAVLRAYVNGTEVLTFTDTTPITGNTRVGFGLNGGSVSVAAIDDIYFGVYDKIPPSINSVFSSNITSTTAILKCDVNTGNQTTTTRFQWDIDSNAVWANDQPSESGTITVNSIVQKSISGLIPNTKYFYRAYTTNVSGGDTSFVNFFTTQQSGGQTQVITVYPAESSDDAWAYNKTVYRSSSNNYLGFITASRHSAVRFRNVGIPPDAVIDSAFLFVTSYANRNSAGANVRIFGNDTSNAGPLGASYSEFLARARTTSYTDWNNIVAFVDNIEYRSPHIGSIVQEIINRPDWIENNSLLFWMMNNGSSAAGRREYSQWDYLQGQQKPRLVIYYHTGQVVLTPPSIDSIFTSDITTTSAILKSVVNAGNQSTAARFQWDIDSNTIWENDQPSENGAITIDGIVQKSISGLTPNTTYFYRTYVTNALGSDTSEVKYFNTLSDQATVTDTFFMNNRNDDFMYYGGSTTGSVSRFGETSNNYRGIEQIYKNVSIQQNAEITSAVLEFKAAVSNSSIVVADIYTDLRSDPVSVMIYSQYNTYTNFSPDTYQYTVPAFTSGNFYQVDLTNLIQERINHSNWNDGDNLGIIIKGNPGLTAGSFREITRAENSLTDNKLIITYNSTLPKIAGKELVEYIPKNYELFQNYPNPFNPTTSIQYQIPSDGLVTIKIYDILGNELKSLVNEQQSVGRYTINYDASDLASGIYLYSIRVNDFVSTKKMILLK